MRNSILFFSLVVCIGNTVMAQTPLTKSNFQTELKGIAVTFMDCLIKKDSVKFVNLFNENPITFVRMMNKNSQQGLVQENIVVKKDYYNDDYKKFYSFISAIGYNKVKTDTLDVKQDDYTASVTFNYSFWKGGKKKSWGQESLGLIYKNNQWRITRVIYSMQFEGVEPVAK